MRKSRLLPVALFAILIVLLILLVNVRKPALQPLANVSESVPNSFTLSPDRRSLFNKATTDKTEFAFTTSTAATVIKESHDISILYINDIYVKGHDRPHPELCASLGSSLSLVILVTSAPSHSEKRDTIRLKWGQHASKAGVAFAFMLGVPDPNLFPSVEAEDELHGDIVMGRFVDSYSNLTLKTLSMLEWVETYCSQASYLLKTDDDMNIDIDRLLVLIKTPDFVTANRKVWGYLMHETKPIRTTESSYYLSPVQFPETVYPDYMLGAGYLMTTDCIHSLRELSQEPNTPYIRIEDAFFTGMLASRLHIQRIHVPDFFGKIVIPL